MSEITTFFRHCPSCGKRFEIRLVGKKLVDEKEETDERPSAYPPYSPYYNDVVEGVPMTVDIKEFQYSYRCKHCGHQWSEIRSKRSEAWSQA
jgi:DNA-directed RNA polymerase subunit RPC12/RpoP